MSKTVFHSEPRSAGYLKLPHFLLVLYTIMIYIRPYELSADISTSFVQKLAAAGVLISILGSAKHIEWRGLWNGVVKLILLFFGIICLSIPMSVWPGGSFNFVFGYVVRMVLVFLFIVITTSDIKRLGRLVVAIGICNAVVAGFTVQSFFYSNKVAFGYRAILDDVGVFSDPNELALCFVISLPLLYFAGRAAVSRKMKMLYVAAMTACILGTLVTYSRGGMLGITAVFISILVLDKRKRKRNLIVFLMIGGIALASNLGIEDRMNTIFHQELDEVGSIQARVRTLKTGVSIFLENPVLGVGANSFAIAEGATHGNVGKWNAAHNAWLEVAAETGFFGLIVFVGCFVWCLKVLVSIIGGADEDSEIWRLSCGLISSLLGFMVCGTFLSMAYSWYFFYLMGLSASVFNIFRINNYLGSRDESPGEVRS